MQLLKKIISLEKFLKLLKLKKCGNRTVVNDSTCIGKNYDKSDKKVRTSNHFIHSQNRKILFFGSRHSWNLNNKQVKLIKNILKRFKPELILLETTKIIEHKNLKEAIMKKEEVASSSIWPRKTT
jgi:hypothetical protein